MKSEIYKKIRNGNNFALGSDKQFIRPEMASALVFLQQQQYINRQNLANGIPT